MDIMDRVARRHKLRVLMHEKPFAGINGSGKHNNWSMATDTGVNLLAPGKTPKTNLMFLTFFVNTIKAVHDYADTLRASIARPGTTTGLAQTKLLLPSSPCSLVSSWQSTGRCEGKRVGDKFDEQDEAILKLDLHRSIPELLSTIPTVTVLLQFAFTGNKFEFRAVGSTANCANLMTTLNTITAQTPKNFKEEVDGLIEKGEKKRDRHRACDPRIYREQRKSRFSKVMAIAKEWHHEAERRGLPNIPTTPLALDVMVTAESRRSSLESNTRSQPC